MHFINHDPDKRIPITTTCGPRSFFYMARNKQFDIGKYYEFLVF